MLVLGLTIQAWLTILVILAQMILMAKTKIAPEFIALGGLTVLLLSGAVTAQEAVSGFGSESVIVTGAQDIVIMGLMQSGALTWVVQTLLRRPSRLSRGIIRLFFPVAALSSVMEDLTVATAFAPVVRKWARKIKMAPSKLLIVAAYASLMGGTLTLIGTPPNIIISSLYAERAGEHMGIFSVTIPALLCMAAGLGAILLFRKRLPERKSPEEHFSSTMDYTVELLVPTENDAVGKTVEEAKLDNVPGGRLIEIVRFDSEVISPVPKDEFILGGDHLVYSGEVDEVMKLKRTRGLVNATHHVFSVKEMDIERRLRTATVVYNGSLAGKRIGDTDFEQRSNSVLVAVSRSGERIPKSPREIVLEPGDTLLLECPPNSSSNDSATEGDVQFFDSNDTITVGKKSVVSGLILLVMVALVAFKVLSLLEATIFAATATMAFRCCSIERARHSLEWDILIMIACTVVFGKAIEANGITTLLSSAAQTVSGGHPFTLLVILVLVVAFFTEFLSNTVTAAIFFPIVYDCATAIGCNPVPYTIATMLAVSTSYMTPFGSPVNMVIYGAGGYKYSDFVKVGLPVKIITIAAILVIIPLMYSLK